MLCSMIEIEHLFTKWQRLTQITPVVRRAIGHFNDSPVRTLPQRPHHFGGSLTLEGGFIGLRHPGHAPGAQPLAMAIIIGHRGTAHLLIARWATGRFAR